MIHEHCRTYHADSGRASDDQPVVAREKDSSALGSKSTDYSIGGTRYFQSRYRQAVECFPPHRPVMARTLFSSPVSGFGERRPSSRAVSKDFSKENNCYCQCYPPHNTAECNSLECAQYGKSSRCQSNDRSPHMARVQSQASPGQEIQTQSRQKISRETLRHCRSVPESAGQSAGFMCR